MSDFPRRSLTPLHLILCIALGLWLGAVAIAASAWLAWRIWPSQVERVLPTAPANVEAPVRPAPPPGTSEAQQQMFERYQQTLQREQDRQAVDAAQADPRNLDNPRCQFWLEQHRNAPTDKSQAQVQALCR